MIGRSRFIGGEDIRARRRLLGPDGLVDCSIVFGQPGFESRDVISFFLKHTKSSYIYYRLLSYIHTRSPIHTLLYTNTYTH